MSAAISLSRFRFRAVMTGALFLLAAVTVCSLCCGAEFFSPARMFRAVVSPEDGSLDRIIVINIRLVRTVTAGLCGALLALSGTLFQGLFRNPLADPFCIGVSSGASLGAVIALLATGASAAAASAFAGAATAATISAAAFCGSLAAAAAALGAAELCGSNSNQSSVTMLLAGTTIASFISAAVSLLMTIKPQYIQKMYLWGMGSFNGVAAPWIPVLAAAALVAGLSGASQCAALDILGSGEAQAQTIGVSLRRTRIVTAAAASLAAAVPVACCGIVGFIGLTAPHLMRTFVGAAHKKLIPAAMTAGALFAVAADILGRTVIRPAEIPAGVITALLGSPFFLAILFSGARKK